MIYNDGRATFRLSVLRGTRKIYCWFIATNS